MRVDLVEELGVAGHEEFELGTDPGAVAFVERFLDDLFGFVVEIVGFEGVEPVVDDRVAVLAP